MTVFFDRFFFPSQITQTRPGLELPFTADMDISVEDDAVVVQLVIAALMILPGRY